jgi:hypothetical protein
VLDPCDRTQLATAETPGSGATGRAEVFLRLLGFPALTASRWTNDKITDLKHLAYSSAYLLSLNDLNGALNSFSAVTPSADDRQQRGSDGDDPHPHPEPSGIALFGGCSRAMGLPAGGSEPGSRIRSP